MCFDITSFPQYDGEPQHDLPQWKAALAPRQNPTRVLSLKLTGAGREEA